MVERMIQTAGIELCTESFGSPVNPPVLLITGVGASMLWWEEGFCRMLAEGGRFVIRYDHRDTGRSVTYEPGHPGYTGGDLVADAAGVLGAYDIPAAHIAGVSAGGAFAQILALDFPQRVLSLVLISTSPALPGDRALPPPAEQFRRFVATERVDWSDAESVTGYLAGYSRVLFDLSDVRSTAEFLPQHHAQRQTTLQIISAAEANGHGRVAEMNRQVAGNLDKIIATLEADGQDGREAAAGAC